MAVELLASPIISVLTTTLIPYVNGKIPNLGDVKDEMVKLRRTLRNIQAVISDAEKQQLEKETVRLWLQDLDDVVHDAEDILDEFAYVGVRDEGSRKRKRISNFLSPSKNPYTFNGRMHLKIVDLNKRMDQISNEKDRFNFVNCTRTISTSRDSSIRETSSYVKISELIGLDSHVSNVIDLLINSSEVYSIIRIVGMGGVGKTTLSQAIFSSDILNVHFEISKWVCVSGYSSKKQIYNQLLDSEERKKYATLEEIESSLRKKLQNQRCLIVLDDMWKDKDIQWDDILNFFLHISAQGSKVIVTTRSDDVPSNMSSLHNYRLVPLSVEESWTLLEKIVFAPGGAERKPNLIKIAQNIAKKCGGVPLAIKVLGGLMYNSNEQKWQEIEDDEVWKLKEGDEKIIRVLKLSYDYLEPHMKQCFKYVSLFPKDHTIGKKNIIMLWMAEGFLTSSSSYAELEKVGNDYFNCLLRNSLLQDEKKNKFGEIKSCKMHDLVHDLAKSLTRTECSRVYDHRWPVGDVSSLRRVNLIDNKNDFSSFFRKISGAKKLRAFICAAPKINSNDVAKLVGQFSYLRMLDLSNSEISVSPSSIGKLIHLRYLNLSNYPLARLPESIAVLYNLQSLILKNCTKLRYLPRNIGKLVKLRHLIIRNKGTDKWSSHNFPMLREVRKLTSLRYMPVFSVGNKNSAFGIEELKELNLLRDKLHILNLEKVSDRNNAEGGALNEKQYILRLELHWTKAGDRINSGGDDFEVLEGLQPHSNLKQLGIHNYIGSKFSTWMMNDPITLLPNLVSIVLKNCSKCENLPPLGLLPCLKFLQIAGLESVKRIGNEFYVSPNSTHRSVSSFLSLEAFSILRMDNLVEWHDYISPSSSSSAAAASSFPCLKYLRITGCRKLTVTPIRLPSLINLEFQDVNGEFIGSVVESNLTSLTHVDIRRCNNLVFLPRGLLRRNMVLQSLVIFVCERFEGFITGQDVDDEEEEEEKKGGQQIQLLPDSGIVNFALAWCPALMFFPSGIERLAKLEILTIGCYKETLEYLWLPTPNINEEGSLVGPYFPALRSLAIYGWFNLKSLPDQIQYLTSLKTLCIEKFHSLVALPEWLGNLTSLQELTLNDCRELKELPSEGQMLRLRSLKRFKIARCQLLEDRCKVGGDEYHKISHMTKISESYYGVK